MSIRSYSVNFIILGSLVFAWKNPKFLYLDFLDFGGGEQVLSLGDISLSKDSDFYQNFHTLKYSF